jgi:hypothetical protein
MKLDKYRRVLVSLSLVFFLGFGWIDSLRSIFDYLLFGSVPAVTEQTGKEGTSAPDQTQPRTLDTGTPQCPGCPRPRPPGLPPPPPPL